MPPPKKEFSGGAAGKNGNRSSFRTDTAISNGRFGNERVLQPWVPDSNDTFDDSLEKPSGGAGWDQFAENERRFGLTTDYDENIYTTAINKNHPEYRERFAAADRKAREIERSVASTAHVAEERIMDYIGGKDQGNDNEEDKYSGVRRHDFPALSSSRENRYTPPAKRAPSGQSTVKGAPIDPAIISSQIKVTGKAPSTPTPDEPKARSAEPTKNGVAPRPDSTKPGQGKVEEKATEATVNVKTEKTITPQLDTPANNRVAPPQAKEGTPSATSTVERDVLKEFKNFASQQRESAQKIRSSKAKADKEVKLTELKKFATTFKLSTPVPSDLVSIIAKDPVKQKEIQAKAIRNAEDVAKAKADDKDKVAAPKDGQAKLGDASIAKPAADNRAPRGPQGTAQPVRHTGNRPFPQQQYQPFRNNRNVPQNMPQQPQTGTLSSRLRNVEQQKLSQTTVSDGRTPPTGPANSVDPGINRRLSGVPSHMGGPKLNPNSHEFRPSPFAATFNPNSHQSASSSPRSAVNNIAEQSTGGQLIRRKTKAVDVNKCRILSHIKTIAPPQGRKWDDNGGLRPSYDTLPTWRQLQDEEKEKSETMRLTYVQLFERQFFGGSAMPTPNPSHAVPHMAHQHQLPFHLQQGAHHLGPRQSPHMSHMQMHNPQHSNGPHPQYGHDDHRMMHSSSAQSFASPRLGQVGMAAYPGMNSPAHVPYSQPMYMGPGAPQMGQYRSFSNNSQYMVPQQGQMGGPMMMQPQFMPGHQGMVGGPQMMYPSGHPHFMPQTGPPQGGPGANGYSSPGRPAAPMMAHQGSQQGQPMYGMSPSVQYSQPVPPYGQGQPSGAMPNSRGYNNGGPQHFGTSPSQGPPYGAQQQRSGSSSYNKVHHPQNPNQSTPQNSQILPAINTPNRAAEGTDEAK